MWKKEEAQTRAAERPEVPMEQERKTPGAAPRGDRATIGRSITIKGEVTGDEDLVIQGRVEGSVDLKQNSVTIGPEGEVKADISGRVVTVEGSVEGNLRADEQVVLRSSARVQGDISSPRVTLEDGAYFRGGVDMTESSGRRTGEPGRKPEVRAAQGGTGKIEVPTAEKGSGAAQVPR
jgi:cytoskeletal protein CcmA (bactofilin family)